MTLNIKKINKILNYYIKNPKLFRYKSKEIFFSHIILKLKYYKPNKNIVGLKYNWECYKYLFSKYNSFLKELPIYHECGNKKKVIRRMWLQGENEAPLLNKTCLNSLRKFIKGMDIIVISEENIHEYVKIPDYITEKYKEGIITKAHYSDIIRCELLIKYGGTRIDSTVLLTDYQKDFFDCDFFVFSNEHRSDESIILSSRFITANKNNPILLTTRDLLYKYRKNNNYLINYFLFHIFFTISTKKYPEIWNKVPKYSNIPPHTMQYEITNQYNKERFQQLKKISSIHKLNFKIDKTSFKIKGSIYDHIQNSKEI